MTKLSESDESALVTLATALVDQQRARPLVMPQENAPGYWFGGGNLVREPDGSLLLVGRYRNAGDSRRKVAAGERGLELALFRLTDSVQPPKKVASFPKSVLGVGDPDVLSIEGSALRIAANGAVELFVSSEKAGIDYPPGLEEFLKPGTGVWTIDRIAADSVDDLGDAPIAPLLESRDSRFLHVKDPLLWDPADGRQLVLFCTHPYCWTSSNSGYAELANGRVVADSARWDFFPRGTTWDVAITRVTCVCDVPRVGRFRNRNVALVFYDGGESIRQLDEHAAAVARPRGYSCEEIGGAAYIVDDNLDQVHRLSRDRPLFVSPWGTGCSRYVDVLATDDAVIATWQQAQADGSQPLVMHSLDRQTVASVLS